MRLWLIALAGALAAISFVACAALSGANDLSFEPASTGDAANGESGGGDADALAMADAPITNPRLDAAAEAQAACPAPCKAPQICRSNGTCGACGDGPPCGTAADCCSGKVCTDDQRCASSCVAASATCSKSIGATPCCVGTTCTGANGMTTCTQCRLLDQICTDDLQCCSTSCFGGKCVGD